MLGTKSEEVRDVGAMHMRAACVAFASGLAGLLLCVYGDGHAECYGDPCL